MQQLAVWIKLNRVRLSLALILLTALGLRLWNYDFDPLKDSMPLTHDAFSKFIMANTVADGNHHPLHYKQPYFLIYTLGFLFKAFRAMGLTDGGILWRLSSVYMILLSVLTVWITHRLAKLLFEDDRAALWAAMLLAVVPINVIGSRYIKEDIPLMMFTDLTILLLVLLLKTRRPMYYALAGLSIGCAVSTKYAALGLIPFYLLAHVCVVAGADRGARLGTLFSPWFFAGLILTVAAFLAFNPYVIPEWDTFREGFLSQTRYAGRRHNDGTAIAGRDYGWTFYLRYALAPGMTLPLSLAALSGIALALRRGNRAALFVLAWMVCTYLGLESSKAKPFPFFARYAHALVPCLCAFAGLAVAEALRVSQGRHGLRAGVVLGVALVVGTPLCKSAVVTQGLERDTRIKGSNWIDWNLEEGSSIYLDDAYYSPRPSAARFRVGYQTRMFQFSPSDLSKLGVDYAVLNSFRTDRYAYSYRFSERARDIREAYQLYERECTLIKEIRPKVPWQTYGFHNPIIRIYRVPEKALEPPAATDDDAG